MAAAAPTIDAIRNLRDTLSKWLVRTPVMRCPALERVTGAQVHAKLEFLQQTGTFKSRGALAVLLQLSDAERAAGVTAVSAGNHAIATAYAARVVGTQFVDELIMVDDDQLRTAMRFLFVEMKLAVEPACAASTAALLGPLAERLCGRKVVILLCGSNIDWHSWQQQAYPGISHVA